MSLAQFFPHPMSMDLAPCVGKVHEQLYSNLTTSMISKIDAIFETESDAIFETESYESCAVCCHVMGCVDRRCHRSPANGVFGKKQMRAFATHHLWPAASSPLPTFDLPWTATGRSRTDGRSSPNCNPREGQNG